MNESPSGPSTRAAQPGLQPLRVAGMALQNGLLVHSAGYWAAAIRDEVGAIQLASGEKPSRLSSSAAGRFPILRGVLQLADAVALLPEIKRRLAAAVLPIEAPRVVAAAGAAAVAGMVVQITAGSASKRPLLRELAVAGLTLAPVVVALKGTDIARYHGAEHRSIGEFESRVGGTGDSAEKEHARCGSNLVAPLLLTNALGNMVLRKAFHRPPPGMMLLTAAVSLGAAMELFRWMTRHPDSPAARGLALPGYWLQHFLTTAEPTEAHMEVGRAALAELVRLEGLTVPA